ncbi:MAG: UDP-N-acetylglucosamine 2-epimerase [Bacteroidota bacterium]
MRHVLYLSGTRADYGLMRHCLNHLKVHPQLKLSIAATGMHLMETFGYTVEEILADGHDVLKLSATYEQDDPAAMARFGAKFSGQLVELCMDLKPDALLLLGDRAEMLSGATVGTYLGIPTAHIHGGELSATVDEAARHAITKLSHLHFAATTESRDRLLKLGEEPWRITLSGGPGLDGIGDDVYSRQEVEAATGLQPGEYFALVLQHPVSHQIEVAPAQITATLEAVKASGLAAVVIYPNADAGGRAMIDVIEQYRQLDHVHIFPHVQRKLFLSLMKHGAVMVGNSSAGIIEAASFHLPVVNVGQRQAGRQRAANVVDTDPVQQEILLAIKKCLEDQTFLLNLQQVTNPYGDGHAAERVAERLASFEVNERLLQKRMTY